MKSPIKCVQFTIEHTQFIGRHSVLVFVDRPYVEYIDVTPMYSTYGWEYKTSESFFLTQGPHEPGNLSSLLSDAGGTAVLLVEAQTFLLMLTTRTVILTDADGHPTTALFRLHLGFHVDGSLPADRIVQHDGAKCLRVGYLEQNA